MAEAAEKGLVSQDVAQEKREQLKQLFPEVVADGKIDFEQLQRVLGDWVAPGKERYGLTWPGRAECMRVIQAPSIATLRPDREESVDFDDTHNVFIEGDNLEVLKLLQKAYFGKVKMIYIDPPYNTGREFIYPDRFQDPLDTYLAYTGQKDEKGRKLSTDAELSGRLHANWLSMMYPRLYLARTLLRDDGAIFVSIDDHEQANLKILLDCVFGSENFVASVIWQKVFSPKNSAQYFSDDHDYVLIYARNKDVWRPELLPRSADADNRYANPDDDARGPWTSSDLSGRNFYGEGSYDVRSPSGNSYSPPRGRYWVVSQARFDDLDRDNRIWWGANGSNMPRLKRFLSEVKHGMVPQTLWKYEDVGHTQEAKKELLDAVDFESTGNVLNSVKPTRLIRRAIQIGTRSSEGDIVLDFFAGSGPTAHAVFEQNKADMGNRRFVLVQLPEPLATPEKAFSTIADLGKSRIRKVANRIRAEQSGSLDHAECELDLGFKLFKLDRSNFATWGGDAGQVADFAEQLELHVDHIDPDSGAEDILYELLLKAGFELATKVARRTLAGKDVFAVAGGALLICLEKQITPELIEAMADAEPLQVICLDEGFRGNDQLKANAVQTFKARATQDDEAIVFRTV